jgi:hypothetical protein
VAGFSGRKILIRHLAEVSHILDEKRKNRPVRLIAMAISTV